MDRFAPFLGEALRVNSTLLELYLNGNMMGDKAGQIIIEALQFNSTLRRLDLQDNSLSDPTGAALGASLRVNSTLQRLNLEANSFAEKTSAALTSALKFNSSLLHLNLSKNPLTRGFCYQSKLGEALQFNSTLTELILREASLDDRSGALIGDSLRYNFSLQTLVLTSNSLGGPTGRSLAEGLRRNTTLTHLNLDQNAIGDQAGSALGQALKSNQHLRVLQLQDNGLAENAGVSLGDALVGNPSLLELRLSVNHLAERSGHSIAQGLANNSTLRLLDLDSNYMGRADYKQAGIIPICQALARNSTLSHLCLFNNSIAGNSGKLLAIALQSNAGLIQLSLGCNPLNEVSGAYLADALKHNTTLRVLELRGVPLSDRVGGNFGESLLVNSTLVSLDLADASLGDAFGVWIGESLRRNTTLMTLVLRRNQLGEPGCTAIATALRSNTSLTQLDLRNNPFPPGCGGALAKAVRRNMALVSLDLEETRVSDAHRRFIAEKIAFNRNPGDLAFYTNKHHLDFHNWSFTLPVLDQIPFFLFRDQISSIDFTGNPNITQIPAALGHLNPEVCTKIQFDVDNLGPTMRPFARDASTILSFAKAMLEGALIPLNQLRLMVVGRAAAGKTSLLRRFYGEKYDGSLTSTDGIDLGEFSYFGMRFSTWDFGGQSVYRYTHQLFLGEQSIYLLMFKLVDPPDITVKELRFWLSSITTRTHSARILLVGSHEDQARRISPTHAAEVSQAVLAQISAEFSQVVPPNTQIYHVSTLPGADAAIEQLLSALVTLAKREPIHVPRHFAVADHFFSTVRRAPPIMPLNDAIASLSAIIKNVPPRDLHELIRVLEHLGSVMVFPRSELPSGGILVLTPRWLSTLFTSIITTKHRFVDISSGVISHDVIVNQLWKNSVDFPAETHDHLLHLLVELQVIFPFMEKGQLKYFVPCRLREEAPDLDFCLPWRLNDSHLFQFTRLFELSSIVPVAVIPPLLIALMERGELRVRWQHGVVARLPEKNSTEEVWLLLSIVRANTIQLKMWGTSTQVVAKSLRWLRKMIQNRVQEFYHIPYSVSSPCPFCEQSDTPSMISDVALHDAILSGRGFVACDVDPTHQSRIDHLAPELLFEDLRSAGFLFDFEHFTKVNFLGQGSYGKVMLMQYNQPVSIISTLSNRTSVSTSSTEKSSSSSSSSSIGFEQTMPLSSTSTSTSTNQVFTSTSSSSFTFSHSTSISPPSLSADRSSLSVDPSSSVSSLSNSAVSISDRPVSLTQRSRLARYAVKVLKLKSDMRAADSSALFNEFFHEVYLMSSLHNPYIVNLQGICTHPLAIVMELVGDGGTLTQQLSDPLDSRYRIFSFAKQLLNTVSEHVAGPRNITRILYLVEHAHRLDSKARAVLKTHCQTFLQEQYATMSRMQQTDWDADHDPFKWIIKYKERDPSLNLFLQLQVEYETQRFPLSDDALSVFCPPLPCLSEIANKGMLRVQQCFAEWRAAIDKSTTIDDPSNPDHQGRSLAESLCALEDKFLTAIQRAYDEKFSAESHRQLNDSLESISDLLQSTLDVVSPISPALRLKIAGEIAAGVAYLHNLNPPMVHRDLKTANIFLARHLLGFPLNQPDDPAWSEPLTKVGDFGLSVRMLHSGHLQIRDRNDNDPLLNLNPIWASPELLRGEKYTTAVDVYAFGFVLWELVTRQIPFSDIFPDAIKGAILSGHRPPLTDPRFHTVVSPQYVQLMCSCWHEHPTKRPTMQQVSQALTTMISAEFASSSSSSSSSSSVSSASASPLLISQLTSAIENIEEHSESRSSICRPSLDDAALPSSAPYHAQAITLPSDDYGHITCILAPFAAEQFWVGQAKGMISYFQLDAGTAEIQRIECQLHEKHSLRVNALIFSPGQGELGTVWSGSEDGAISVWAPHPQSQSAILDNCAFKAHCLIYDLNSSKGRLHPVRTAPWWSRFVAFPSSSSSPPPVHNSPQKNRFWLEFENGILCFFANRSNPVPSLSIVIQKEVEAIRYDHRIGHIDIVLKSSDKCIILAPLDDSPSHFETMKAHYLTLTTVHQAPTQTTLLRRLATHSFSSAGIFSLIGVDYSTWCATTDFNLSEWALMCTTNEHGLHETFTIHPVRRISLQVDFLPTRLRSICGFQRVNQRTLWVAIGNRWLVIDLSDSSTPEIWVPAVSVQESLPVIPAPTELAPAPPTSPFADPNHLTFSSIASSLPPAPTPPIARHVSVPAEDVSSAGTPLHSSSSSYLDAMDPVLSYSLPQSAAPELLPYTIGHTVPLPSSENETSPISPIEGGSYPMLNKPPLLMTSLAFPLESPNVCILSKITTSHLIRYNHSVQIFTPDEMHQIGIWYVNEQSGSELGMPCLYHIIQPTLPGLKTFSLSQPDPLHVWFGLSSGNIISWNLLTQKVEDNHLQPFFSSPHLRHQSFILSLCRVNDPSHRRSIIWSIDADRKVIRHN